MAVQGKKVVEINKELIISQIGSLSIYNYYITGLKIGVPMLSIFRKEKHPSFWVKESSNGYYHKDYGAPEFTGGPIDLVMQLFSLSFTEAIKKIAKDFGLSNNGVEYKVKIKEVVNTPKKKKIPDVIEVIPKPFGKEHLQYLQEFHISSNSLGIFKEVKVVAVDKWFLNRARMGLKRNEVCFAYIMEGKGIKLYRPYANKKDKWLSTISFREIMGLSNLENTEFGIISKSLKDCALIGQYITKNVCCVQGEDFSSFTEENIEWINKNCKQVYVNFDGDFPGKKASWSTTRKTGWKHINVPDHFVTEGYKDFSDLTRAYGPQLMIDHFKSKIKEL